MYGKTDQALFSFTSSRLTPQKRATGTDWTQGYVGRRVDLNGSEKRKEQLVPTEHKGMWGAETT
jgi:hypothetical protein